MIICRCFGLSERDVRAVVATGAWRTEDVAAACGAGSDCGACVVLLEDLLAEAARSEGPQVVEVTP